jgi:hypothetical protein
VIPDVGGYHHGLSPGQGNPERWSSSRVHNPTCDGRCQREQPGRQDHLAGSLALQPVCRIGYTDHTMDWRLRDGQRRLRVDGKIRVADQAGQGKVRQ